MTIRYVATCCGMFLSKGKGASFHPSLDFARLFKTPEQALIAGRSSLGVSNGVPLHELSVRQVAQCYRFSDGGSDVLPSL